MIWNLELLRGGQTVFRPKTRVRSPPLVRSSLLVYKIVPRILYVTR